MTITNGYATLDQIKADMRLSAADLVDDARLELAIEAASRQIDAHTDRRFWQDAAPQAKTYAADDPTELWVDDISTTTGLVVKVDDNLDGTYETTLTLGTDYVVAPFNETPYYKLIVRPTACTYFPVSDGVASVEVTARFGYASVPSDVTKACLIQAAQLFKASDAVFGVAQFAEAGFAMRVQNRLNPMAEALLEPYCKPRVG